MAYIVDQLYPPIKHIEEEDNEYTSFNYWREPVAEIDINACDISGSSAVSASVSLALPTTVPATASSSPSSGGVVTVSTPTPAGKLTPTAATIVQQALQTIPEN